MATEGLHLRRVALAYHPMWLLIREDTLCAERTPPWGAPDIATYAERVRRNLQALAANPRIFMNYDFSAGELEDVAARFPDLGAMLRDAVRRGQLIILNGTYSQPHLHTLSLEASVRQFQFGLRTIREQFGYRVLGYVMQEPGYTDQTPQLLNAFGYRYGNRGAFVTRRRTLSARKGDSAEPLFLWKGLNGDGILAVEPGPEIEIRCPDMAEIEPKPDEQYVNLDEWVERTRAGAGPMARARLYIPWGYIEGTDADELLRLDTAAETALAQLETAAALLRPAAGRPMPPPRLEELWKSWLLAQHHDAYWSGGPELRSKSCGWLRDVIRQAADAGTQILKAAFPDGAGARESLLLFGVYPMKHAGVAEAPWEGAAPDGFVNATGRRVPCQRMPAGEGKGRLLVPFALQGAGIEEMAAVGAGRDPAPPEAVSAEWSFRNSYFSAELSSDGSIRSVRTPEGREVLDPGGPAATLTASEAQVEYVRAWQVIGPFPNPTADADSASSGGECRPGGQALQWTPAAAIERGLVSVQAPAEGTTEGWLYARAEIPWPSDAEVLFTFDADFRRSDGFQVLLNGEPVHTRQGLRELEPGSHTFTSPRNVKLRLRKGANRLLLKYHSRRSWAFCARFQTRRNDFSFATALQSARLWKGPVADVFEAVGSAAGVAVTRSVILYHDLPWFEMRVECDFRHSSVGDFYDDTTKLALRWPKGERTSLVHGFGGGAGTPDEPDVVFHPVNWLDLAGPAAGLAVIHFGALKHCLRDGLLYTVLAWGGDTIHFNNRSRFGDWSKKLDLRLNGKHSFRFALFPHSGDWRAAAVPGLATSLLRPPLTRRRRAAAGDNLLSEVLLSLDGGVVPTAVYEEEERLICRVYEPCGKTPLVKCRLLGAEASPRVCDVAGKPSGGIRPWDIRNLEFPRPSAGTSR